MTAPFRCSFSIPPGRKLGNPGQRSVKVVQGVVYQMWLRHVPSPGVHDLAALLQQVGSPVGGFDGVLDNVG